MDVSDAEDGYLSIELMCYFVFVKTTSDNKRRRRNKD